MPHFYKTKAIVLGKKPYRESSTLYSLFTEAFGLVNAVAYGAGHFGSKRSGHLDISNVCEIEFSKKNIFIIESCKAIQVFPCSRNHFEKSYLTLHALSFLKNSLPVEESQNTIFAFVTEFFSALEKEKNIDTLALFVYFQWKVLSFLGVIPKWKEVLCHAPQGGRTYEVTFSPLQIQCNACLGRKAPYDASMFSMLMSFEEKPMREVFRGTSRMDGEGALEFLGHFRIP